MSNKPKVSDGFHFRWYFHPFGGWTVVHVAPWDHARCCFDRPGFSENHWVTPTQPWQWGPKCKEPKLPVMPKWVGKDMARWIALNNKVKGDGNEG